MANSSFSHLIDCRLCVNIDHVATVRQARGTDEPDPVRAAVLAELGGANGITVHLREDRRHIQDRDVELLLGIVRTFVNLELAAEEEVLALAERWRPAQAEAGAAAIELHTGEYANAADQAAADHELARLEDAAARAEAAGLGVHAGHGLTYENVQPVAAIAECEELNIGHSIVSRSVLVGMERAVLEMSELVREARG